MNRVLLAIALCLALAARAPGQALPTDAVAWWSFDPSRFGAVQAGRAQRDAAIAAMRAAVSSRLIGEGRAAAALEGLLVAAEVGSRPHTLAVLDFAASRPAEGAGMDVHRLQMVLELRTAADPAKGGGGEPHQAYIRTLKAILVDGESAELAAKLGGDAPTPIGAQRFIDLPGGARGVALAHPDAEPWRTVAWTSTPESFVAALGEGALEGWFAEQADAADPRAMERAVEEPRWLAHRAAVDSARPAGEVFLEAFADINALRRGYLESFVNGRAGALLHRLGISETSELMIHGRMVPGPDGAPPMIALDATWTEPTPDGPRIARRALTEHAWPADLRMAPPPGSYILVAGADWPAVVDLAFDVFVDLQPDAKRGAVRQQRRSWESANTETLAAVLGAFKPWAVFSDTPTPMLPIPGASTLFVEVADGADGATVEADLSHLLASWRGVLDVDAQAVWSLRVDPGGVLRMPAWGFAGPARSRVLIGGWGPPVVTLNRQRMGE